MTENEFLTIIETAHHERTSLFCYAGIGTDLVVVECGVAGYFPLQGYFWFDDENEAKHKAEILNCERLRLSPRDAAAIVCSSMNARN